MLINLIHSKHKYDDLGVQFYIITFSHFTKMLYYLVAAYVLVAVTHATKKGRITVWASTLLLINFSPQYIDTGIKLIDYLFRHVSTVKKVLFEFQQGYILEAMCI